MLLIITHFSLLIYSGLVELISGKCYVFSSASGVVELISGKCCVSSSASGLVEFISGKCNVFSSASGLVKLISGKCCVSSSTSGRLINTSFRKPKSDSITPIQLEHDRVGPRLIPILLPPNVTHLIAILDEAQSELLIARGHGGPVERVQTGSSGPELATLGVEVVVDVGDDSVEADLSVGRGGVAVGAVGREGARVVVTGILATVTGILTGTGVLNVTADVAITGILTVTAGTGILTAATVSGILTTAADSISGILAVSSRPLSWILAIIAIWV